jgi:hypothetical protein
VALNLVKSGAPHDLTHGMRGAFSFCFGTPAVLCRWFGVDSHVYNAT